MVNYPLPVWVRNLTPLQHKFLSFRRAGIMRSVLLPFRPHMSAVTSISDWRCCTKLWTPQALRPLRDTRMALKNICKFSSLSVQTSEPAMTLPDGATPLQMTIRRNTLTKPWTQTTHLVVNFEDYAGVVWLRGLLCWHPVSNSTWKSATNVAEM